MGTSHRYRTRLLSGDCCYKPCVEGNEHFKAKFGTTTTVNTTRLYDETGQNTDGAMTQKATTDALATKVEITSLSTVAFSGLVDDLIQNDKLILYCGTASEVI